MKKIILFTALFVSTAFITTAQVREEFKFVIKGGFAQSNIYDSDDEDFQADMGTGYTIGAGLEIPIGKFLGLHPEIIATQKGFQGSGSFLGNNYSYKKTTTFLEVPILFALKPFDFLSIVAGPQFAYLLSERNQFESIVGFDQEETFENEDVRNNILGFVAGANLNVNHFTVGGRVGFDFQTNRSDGTSETPRYKNVWGLLTVGYRFY